MERSATISTGPHAVAQHSQVCDQFVISLDANKRHYGVKSQMEVGAMNSFHNCPSGRGPNVCGLHHRGQHNKMQCQMKASARQFLSQTYEFTLQEDVQRQACLVATPFQSPNPSEQAPSVCRAQ